MNPEQVWKSSLVQLQLELNKTTFDAWVRDTRFLSFENGIFRLGAANEMARDWLENRLSGLIRKVLTGILAQDVTPEFHVYIPEETPEDPRVEDPVALDAFWYFHQEAVVRPNEGTYVPGYFVHYLPHLKPEEVLVYFAAYRTVLARHLASGRDYDGLPPSRRLSVSLGKLCERSGLSKNTVIAVLKRAQPGTCLGMLLRANPREDRPPGRHSRRPPDLQVALDIPLLPHHAARISNLLRSLLAAGQSPVDSLRALAAEPYDTLLPLDPDAVRRMGFPSDLSSLDELVCHEIAIFAAPTKQEQNEISLCATYLREYILRRTHTFGLSDYLLRRWFHQVQARSAGAKRGRRPTGALILIAYLRWMCYCRFEQGRVVDCRDTTLIRRGYAELAQVLGAKEKKVYLWLHEEWVKKFVREDWSGQDLDVNPEAGWLSAPRLLRIALIDPVLPEKIAAQQALSTENIVLPQFTKVALRTVEK